MHYHHHHYQNTYNTQTIKENERIKRAGLVDQSQLVFIPEAGSKVEHVLFRIGYRL